MSSEWKERFTSYVKERFPRHRSGFIAAYRIEVAEDGTERRIRDDDAGRLFVSITRFSCYDAQSIVCWLRGRPSDVTTPHPGTTGSSSAGP